MMRCIIAGSRGIKSRKVVESAIRASGWWDRIDVVLGGEAEGVDQEGKEWADRNGRGYEAYPAAWDDLEAEGAVIVYKWGAPYNRAAGVDRNRAMAQNADGLIAVWDGKSGGTRNMIFEARQRDLEVFVFKNGASLRDYVP